MDEGAGWGKRASVIPYFSRGMAVGSQQQYLVKAKGVKKARLLGTRE